MTEISRAEYDRMTAAHHAAAYIAPTLLAALRNIQAEVTSKRGGVEAHSGVSLTYIKRIADEALRVAEREGAITP